MKSVTTQQDSTAPVGTAIGSTLAFCWGLLLAAASAWAVGLPGPARRLEAVPLMALAVVASLALVGRWAEAHRVSGTQAYLAFLGGVAVTSVAVRLLA